MQRYFIQLNFKGTPFNGWQKQQNAPTVQESIEESLGKLLRKPVEIVGAGRTDTGVHASFYIAHFDTDTVIENIPDFIYHLNQIIPYEIAIQKIVPVIPEAHARFDAISRTYQYVISEVKNPFEKDLSYFYNVPLDIDKMNHACEALKKYTDFTSFCKLHSDNKTNICHVYEAVWIKKGQKIIFTIKADRFLRNMVRAIVGTLIDVGREKITFDQFIGIIESKNRSAASTSAPSHGLYLTDISYDVKIYQ